MDASLELIPVDVSVAAASVAASDLHAFLQVGTSLRVWISHRIREYGFEAGKDFRPNLIKNPYGRPKKDYALSLDMAKELAMVERSERGRQARRYFIECEKRLREGRGLGLAAMEMVTVPEWLAELGVDVQKKPAVVEWMCARLARALRILRWREGRVPTEDGFARVPRAAARLALALCLEDARGGHFAIQA